jgi:hypothetical protein
MQKLLDFARPASGVRLFPFFFLVLYIVIYYISIYSTDMRLETT